MEGGPPAGPQEPKYTNELTQMLFGLGDFPSPSAETASLLENYLRLRLGRWAAAAAAAAGSDAEVTPEALVSALHSNKRALAHCVTFHRLLADTRRLTAAGSGDGDEVEAAAGDKLTEGCTETAAAAVAEEVEAVGTAAENCGPLPPFLEAAAADAAEALARLQVERHRRQERLSRCSEALSCAVYERFARCRRCCLLSPAPAGASAADFARFRSWIGPAGARLGKPACRLLSYLASQILAELLDTVKERRVATWPADALRFDAELCASPAEVREALQLRRLPGQR